MRFERLTIPQRISAISMLVVVLAAFLPWASFLGFSVSGLSGDGAITLGAGLVGLVVLLATSGAIGRERTPRRRSQILLLVLAGLTLLTGLIDMTGLAAIGLYLTLFAGMAWVVGAVWQMNIKDSMDAPPASSEAGGQG